MILRIILFISCCVIAHGCVAFAFFYASDATRTNAWPEVSPPDIIIPSEANRKDEIELARQEARYLIRHNVINKNTDGFQLPCIASALASFIAIVKLSGNFYLFFPGWNMILCIMIGICVYIVARFLYRKSKYAPDDPDLSEESLQMNFMNEAYTYKQNYTERVKAFGYTDPESQTKAAERLFFFDRVTIATAEVFHDIQARVRCMHGLACFSLLAFIFSFAV